MSAPALVNPSVQILDISCVKPLHATKRFNLYLPFADAWYKGVVAYITEIIFYSLDSADACNMEALKHGLSLALVPFYPVAGRLHRDSTTGHLTIDCNDDGVRFVEAVTDCDFAELEEKSFPIHELYAELASFSHQTGDPHDNALLSIQVTRFQGGRGIAVGVAASHVVFDAHSLWYFLKSWGQCCRGQGVSLPPLHVRALMSSKFWSMDKSAEESVLGDDTPRLLSRLTTKYYHKVMHFDSTAAQQLKRTAAEESGNVHISTFQAVMACVWKRLTAAHDLPPHHKMCMIVSGDLRHKLLPGLTDAYFGNALLSTSVRATAGDLKRESVGMIAANINESLKVFEDQMYLRERLAALEKEYSNVVSMMGEVDSHYLFVTRGSRLPVYDVDVGMGKPLAVRPADISNDSLVCVYPGREQDSIDVSVCFSSVQTLQAFLCITSPCLDI